MWCIYTSWELLGCRVGICLILDIIPNSFSRIIAFWKYSATNSVWKFQLFHILSALGIVVFLSLSHYSVFSVLNLNHYIAPSFTSKYHTSPLVPNRWILTVYDQFFTVFFKLNCYFFFLSQLSQVVLMELGNHMQTR